MSIIGFSGVKKIKCFHILCGMFRAGNLKNTGRIMTFQHGAISPEFSKVTHTRSSVKREDHKRIEMMFIRTGLLGVDVNTFKRPKIQPHNKCLAFAVSSGAASRWQRISCLREPCSRTLGIWDYPPALSSL